MITIGGTKNKSPYEKRDYISLVANSIPGGANNDNNSDDGTERFSDQELRPT